MHTIPVYYTNVCWYLVQERDQVPSLGNLSVTSSYTITAQNEEANLAKIDAITHNKKIRQNSL